MIRKCAAELLGTALLVFFGVGVATLMFGFGLDGGSVTAGVVATALAFGADPAVPGVCARAGHRLPRQPGGDAGGAARGPDPGGRGHRVLASRQFVGGIVGALVLWGMFSASPLYDRPVTGLGADGWGKASLIHIGVGGAFLAEVILTAMFVFAVLAATSKTVSPTVAGMVIGLTLTVVHLIGIPITGTSVNPARSLGPALIVGGTALSQVWLFILAPLVGGAVAAGAHLLIYPKSASGSSPG